MNQVSEFGGKRDLEKSIMRQEYGNKYEVGALLDQTYTGEHGKGI